MTEEVQKVKRVVRKKETPAETPAEAPAEKKHVRRHSHDKPSFLANAVGRRKTGIARVMVSKGTGNISINGKDYKDYVSNRFILIQAIQKPLQIANAVSSFDIKIIADGGGISSQADAVKLGIARALVQMDPSLKKILGKEGCLVRDSRAKERKKYGRKRARKRFQFSKR
jgi:small subunit ribosomal protein S9